ncbi:SPOR domain-containing protein [Stakelama saccharophila]|uniref:SPOR domain-containing protein n=1 Tax=Stakelama saccharophila TaxID=3075605 RepID=A0ABZ0B7C6_9SPHN|nr:SPOR domain-containing protein [Stakelama sp. W311]WNO52526.1 SPOR domain-containing protein [Stakelama sp. W311]
MKSSNSLLPILSLVLAISPAAAQDVPDHSYPPGDGQVEQGVRPPAETTLYPDGSDGKPRGSSQHDADDHGHYDRTGYALRDESLAAQGGAVAASPGLNAGDFAEVTALDTGATILVKIVDRTVRDNRIIALSPMAANMLQPDSPAPMPVRVRKAMPSPPDLAAISAGRPAAPRLPAPEALLRGLRAQLKAEKPAEIPPPATRKAAADPALVRAGTTTPSRSNPAAASGTERRYVVQVAALSHRDRAERLAGELDGYVTPGGGLYRIRVGPFATRAEAQSARAKIIARGYGDARLYRTDQ